MGKDSARPGVGTRSSPTRSPSQAYPKSVRLRKRREYLAVQRTGRRFHGEHFLAVVRPSRGTSSMAPDGSRRGRVGITVTKKVGSAVIRNRIKRLVREYVRKGAWLGIPIDTVLIAKRSAAGLAGHREVAADLSSILMSMERAMAAGNGRERRGPDAEARARRPRGDDDAGRTRRQGKAPC